jgi:hypothetical protein
MNRACLLAATFLVALACLGPAVPARAQDDPALLEPAAIVAKLVERNPSLENFEAHVRLDAKLHSFPWISQSLEGSVYFKRPSNYTVTFTHVPFYANGFEKIYSDAGDPANWESRFTIARDGERKVEGHRELGLRMVQRVRGMIEHAEAYIDPATWTVSELQYHYYNGGTVAVRQIFGNVGGFSVLLKQDATISIPHVHATATADYSNYHTNTAIDDAVFTKD